jgi:hypothetical protein
MLAGAIEKISGTRPRGEAPATDAPSLKAANRAARWRVAPADWSGLHGLLLGTSLTMGLGMVITVIAILFTRGTSLPAIYGSAALLGVYALGVGLAYYLWDRTRRRRGW